MKRILSMIMVLFAVIFLTACGGDEVSDEVHFRSVLDTEMGGVISLGDSSEQVREVLGAPDYIVQVSENWAVSHYFCADFSDFEMGDFSSCRLHLVTVDDVLHVINRRFGDERFEFQMTIDEMRENFELVHYNAFDEESLRQYMRYYDDNHYLTTEEDAAYALIVTTVGVGGYGADSIEITSITKSGELNRGHHID